MIQSAAVIWIVADIASTYGCKSVFLLDLWPAFQFRTFTGEPCLPQASARPSVPVQMSEFTKVVL